MDLESYNDDQLIIINCKHRKNRKLIHQYLDIKYPTYNRTSIYVNKFKSEITYYKKCYQCERYMPLHHRGKDEVYNWCKHCDGLYVEHEWEFDDPTNYTRKHENNCIVLGKMVIPRKIGTPASTIPDINSIDMKIYIIDPPNKKYNDRNLRKYICQTLN